MRMTNKKAIEVLEALLNSEIGRAGQTPGGVEALQYAIAHLKHTEYASQKTRKSRQPPNTSETRGPHGPAYV